MKVKVIFNQATGAVAFVEASREFLGVLRDLSKVDISVLALVLQQPFKLAGVDESPANSPTSSRSTCDSTSSSSSSSSAMPFKAFLASTSRLRGSDTEAAGKPPSHSECLVAWLERLNPGPDLGKLLTSLCNLAPSKPAYCSAFKVCKYVWDSPLFPASVGCCPVCKHWKNDRSCCGMSPTRFMPQYWGQQSIKAGHPIYRCSECKTYSNTPSTPCGYCKSGVTNRNATVIEEDGGALVPVGTTGEESFAGEAFFNRTELVLLAVEDESKLTDTAYVKQQLPDSVDKTKPVYVCNNFKNFFSNTRNAACTTCNTIHAKARILCTNGVMRGDSIMVCLLQERDDPSGDGESDLLTDDLEEPVFLISDGMKVSKCPSGADEFRRAAGVFNLVDSGSKWITIGCDELFSIACLANMSGCKSVFSEAFKEELTPHSSSKKEQAKD